MRSGNIAERRTQLVELIREKGEISTQEAGDHFGVSSETIRQDFIYLESRHILKKMHGGAALVENTIIEPLVKRQTENYKAKLAIAKKALTYVPQTQGIIGLDMGSTVSILAELIAGLTNQLIITNSYPVLHIMAESKNRIYCLGGEYNAHDMAYQGEQAVSALKKLSMDVCFMGTSGVYQRAGICSSDFLGIGVKQEFIRHSLKKIVLMDSSKFQRSSLIEVAPWSEIDAVITDFNADPQMLKQLSEQVEVIIAPQ